MSQSSTATLWDRKAVPAMAGPMLARLEGCKLESHWDSLSRQWDIGFGSLHMPDGRPVRAGDTITQAQADALLDAQCQTWVHDIAGAITWPLTEVQAAPLICFVHNVGAGVCDADSAFVRMGNAGRIDLMAGQMIGYSHSGGKLVLGLMRRNEYQRQVCMGECAESAAAYDRVFGMTEAQLMPLYNAAYTEAAVWGHMPAAPIVHGPAIVAVTKPAPLARKPRPTGSAQSEADALMDQYN